MGGATVCMQKPEQQFRHSYQIVQTSHGVALQPLGEESSERGAFRHLREHTRAERIYAASSKILLLDLLCETKQYVRTINIM